MTAPNATSYPAIYAGNNKLFMQHYGLLQEALRLPEILPADKLSADNALLERFARFSETEMLDVNFSAHREGLKWDGKDARYPDEQIALFEEYTKPENRFTGISAAAEQGGHDMLNSLQPVFAVLGFKNNPQFYLKEMVTTSAINALRQAATKETGQKQEMLNNIISQLVSGEYTGAMVLTEPQGGSNLNSEMEVTAKIPMGENNAEVTGIKNFITGASTGGTKAKNVIHLVVSASCDENGRLDPKPSVTIVPKYKIDAAGNTIEPLQKNNITISEPYNKPGIEPQILTAVEYKNAEGILIGERAEGWQIMFGVMNPARLKVAAQGVATAQEAYEIAADFATRRGLDTKLQKSIVEHPQTRTKLYTMRAYAMLGTAALMEAGRNLDYVKGTLPLDEIERQKLEEFIKLQTPMLKAYCTERGKEAAELAVAVTAGKGYTNEVVPKLSADIMPATFYEGTNQMMARTVAERQALETLPPDHKQTSMDYFIAQTQKLVERYQHYPDMEEVIAPLQKGLQTLTEATEWLKEKKDARAKDEILAASEAYTMLFGDMTMAVQGVNLYALSKEKLKQGELTTEEQSYHLTNLQTASYFNNVILESGRHKHLAEMKTAGQFAQMNPEWKAMVEEHDAKVDRLGEITLAGVRGTSMSYRPQQQARSA